MPNPRTQKPGRPHLKRDQQQWIYDYIVQQSGRVFHWWSDDAVQLPKGVRSHAMISKYYGRQGLAREEQARQEEASGDKTAALKNYFEAMEDFVRAQHTVFEINDEKRYLYAGVQRNYAKVCELAPYRIERIDVPFEGNVVSGWLHLLPGEPKAPLVFYVPGCDVTCDITPEPMNNPFHKRGWHVFSFDGPGQGQSNMRGIKLTPDNYERAAKAALDQLIERPEIDGDNVLGYGDGFGSWWGLRFAAYDHRLVAVATKTTYSPMYYLMNEEAPRWKQMFAYLMQAASEEDLDDELEKMTLDGYMQQITCPVLMIEGEYNHRDPLEEIYKTFDQLKAPGELWIFADFFQHAFVMPDDSSVRTAMLDWLQDRLEKKPMQHAGQVLYLEPGGPGPNSQDVAVKRHWYEESEESASKKG